MPVNKLMKLFFTFSPPSTFTLFLYDRNQPRGEGGDLIQLLVWNIGNFFFEFAMRTFDGPKLDFFKRIFRNVSQSPTKPTL